MRILKTVGGIADLWTTYKSVKHYKDDLAYSMGDAVLAGAIGFNPRSTNSFKEVSSRFMNAHWPAVTGTAFSELYFNANGAFNSGLGLKLNRGTPKGMNF